MKKIYFATGILITLLLTAVSSFAQIESRADTLKQIEAKRAELFDLEKRFLSPSEEDQTTYTEFLRQPNTGLIRLLPREKYDTQDWRERRKGVSITGGGAYYSFVRLTHEYGYGSDIELDQGSLSTGFAGANYGMLTSLGDTPLENVSLETAAAQVLATHVPPTEEPKARIEQRKWSTGETVDGIIYRDRVPLSINETYLVRSVQYRTSDVLVGFRVLRLDTDGSAIILWKLLKSYPKPQLSQK